MVLGPHAVGAKDLLPGPLAPLGRILACRIGALPDAATGPGWSRRMPLQFVHQDYLGHVALRGALAAWAAGAYNIAAAGCTQHRRVSPGVGDARCRPGPADRRSSRPAPSPRCRSCRPHAQWVEAASHPAIMDTSKAKRDLGWVPRFTALEALRDTLRRGLAQG